MELDILSIYFVMEEGTLNQLRADLNAINTKSVNQNRDMRRVIWRLAEKIVESKLFAFDVNTTYDELKRILKID